jgi:outer membrane protein assembly factor BamE (lipoprotein component of BamABCDE complex)
VNRDNLKEMRPGLTKAQVYELLGTPHFSEGVFRRFSRQRENHLDFAPAGE